MRRRLGISIIFSLLLTAANLPAEIYRDIRPYDTLAGVQRKFSGAKFELLHPAWAKKSDLLYSITGPGLNGMIVVKFTDNVEASVASWEQMIAEFCPRTDPAGADDCSYFQEQLNEEKSAPSAEHEAKTQVDWVRWVPEKPIPVERLVTLYGQPDKSGIDEVSLEPYKEWERGISADVTDDGKSVELINYSFTREEKKKEWMTKHPDSHCDTATSLADAKSCSLEWMLDIMKKEKEEESKPANRTLTIAVYIRSR